MINLFSRAQINESISKVTNLETKKKIKTSFLESQEC